MIIPVNKHWIEGRLHRQPTVTTTTYTGQIPSLKLRLRFKGTTLLRPRASCTHHRGLIQTGTAQHIWTRPRRISLEHCIQQWCQRHKTMMNSRAKRSQGTVRQRNVTRRQRATQKMRRKVRRLMIHCHVDQVWPNEVQYIDIESYMLGI